MPIHKKQDRVRKQLLAIQPAAGAFGFDERAHDRLVRPASQPANKFFEVRNQRIDTGPRPLFGVERSGGICDHIV